jgi:hypothetical protein
MKTEDGESKDYLPTYSRAEKKHTQNTLLVNSLYTPRYIDRASSMPVAVVSRQMNHDRCIQLGHQPLQRTMHVPTAQYGGPQ